MKTSNLRLNLIYLGVFYALMKFSMTKLLGVLVVLGGAGIRAGRFGDAVHGKF